MNFLKKIVLLVTLSCMVFSQTSFAASVYDMDIEGWETLSADTQSKIENGIKPIPDSVTKYHKWCKAKLSFVNDILSPDGYENEKIKGVYYIRNSNIEISTMDTWNPDFIYETVTHELGHFLYSKTYSLWSAKSKEQLDTQFEYWNQYSPECYNKEETFAFLYAMYRAYNSPYINMECKDMINEAEKICDKLYEISTDESGIEIGPGTAEQIREMIEKGK